MVAVGMVFSQLGVIYFLGVAVAAALLACENAIVSTRDLSRVNTAFMTMNGIIGIVYIGFFDYGYRGQIRFAGFWLPLPPGPYPASLPGRPPHHEPGSQR